MPLPRAPRGTLIVSNARLPLPLRRFQPAGELLRLDNARSLRIQFPLDGARLDAGGGAAGFHPVPVKGGRPRRAKGSELVSRLHVGSLSAKLAA